MFVTPDISPFIHFTMRKQVEENRIVGSHTVFYGTECELEPGLQQVPVYRDTQSQCHAILLSPGRTWAQQTKRGPARDTGQSRQDF